MASFESLALANIASILLAEANRTMFCLSYPRGSVLVSDYGNFQPPAPRPPQFVLCEARHRCHVIGCATSCANSSSTGER